MSGPVFAKVGDEHLRREAAVLRTVDFAGIPKVVEYNQAQGRDFLVMEQLPGTPLSEYIGLDRSWKSQILPLAESARIVNGVAACSEALHDAGYLYRDLNLGHIIVSDTGVGLVDHEWDVRLDDSGQARVDSRAGTWETMAPEEFEVGDTMTPSSNVYTLGVVLLQLVSGKNIFHVSPADITDSELQRERAKELHWQRQDISTGNKTIDRLLLRTLSPEQSERYQSVAAFREALGTL